MTFDVACYNLAETFLQDCDLPEELFEGECIKLAQDIQITIENFIADIPSMREREVEARDEMLGTYPDHSLPPV
jgi:hypothetical protein